MGAWKVAFAALFVTRIGRKAFRLDYVRCIFRINEMYLPSLTLQLVVVKLPKIEIWSPGLHSR